MDELVSIIIPVFNEEKKIIRCLRSIITSTYQNLELIVVNDGSTDATENVVKNYINKTRLNYKTIKLITIPNCGPAHARNTGLCQAKGTYISFVDSDDMIHPKMIELLVHSMKKGNDIAICGQLVCNEKGKPKWKQYPLKKQHQQCPEHALSVIMWKQIQMSVCSSLFRKDKIFENGILKITFPENIFSFEDFSFICEYINVCQGFLEVLPFHGYFYCKHKKSLTTKTHTAKELCEALNPILNVGNRINNKSFNSHKLQYAFRFMAFWYVEANRCKKRDFLPSSENWRICIRELNKYADIYMSDNNVSFYRKSAMWIVRKHPEFGRFLAKTIGKVMLLK